MGIGSVIGGAVSLMSSNSASKAASKASAQAEEWMNKAWDIGTESTNLADKFANTLNSISEEYGEHAQQIWQDWEEMYGPLEKNLVNYYNNLDPNKFSTQWKAQIEQSLNKELNQFKQAAAQSGIASSGMMLQAQKDMSYKQAMANAQADIAAPEKVAQMQQGFYGQFGAPQKNMAQNLQGQAIMNKANFGQMGLNNQLSARGSLMGLAGKNQQAYSNSAAGYGQAAGNMFGSGVNMITQGLGSIFG